jgi:hypothetical protein
MNLQPAGKVCYLKVLRKGAKKASHRLTLLKLSKYALNGIIRTLAVYIDYDLPAPRRSALSQPPVWLVSRGQMGELPLWDDSRFHRFASAVVADASIAGLRGES